MWVMGWVKTTSENVRRHDQQKRSAPRNQLNIAAANGTRWTATLDRSAGNRT